MRAALLHTLTEIVGAPHCLAGPDRGPFVVEGRTPGAVVAPGTADEVARVVRAAADAQVPVIPWGGGTAMALGTPPPDDALVVVTRRLGRVLEHEPGDLTATVEAGITVGALQAALAARGQWWPLDPPAPDRASLGGVLAVNAAGPRRHLYGTARDLVVGLRVVGPDGHIIRAGGKVVKNVAGYDLVKLYIGALGTLGLVVDATLKLRPQPEAELVVWAAFPDLAGAARAALAVVGADFLPHSVELLDADAAALVGAGGEGMPGVLVGFDGLPAAVAWQGAAAGRFLAAAGAGSVVTAESAAGTRLLAGVGEIPARVVDPLAAATAAVLPREVGAYLVTAAARARGVGLRLVATAHAGQGLLTLVLASGGPAADGAAVVQVLDDLRRLARAQGGHLRVDWAPLGVKAALSVWDPPGPAVRLMQAIKDRLDPTGVMSPGRFVGGL